MIWTLTWPACSSAERIAPTRPSIMSDGAMMSAPASAWARAWSARAGVGGRLGGKQGEAGDAEAPRFPRPLAQPVDRPARHAGQGRDRLLDPLPFGDEQGPDQVGRGEQRLVDQRSAPGGGAGAAEAKRGIGGGGGHVGAGLSAPPPAL